MSLYDIVAYHFLLLLGSIITMYKWGIDQFSTPIYSLN